MGLVKRFVKAGVIIAGGAYATLMAVFLVEAADNQGAFDNVKRHWRSLARDCTNIARSMAIGGTPL